MTRRIVLRGRRWRRALRVNGVAILGWYCIDIVEGRGSDCGDQIGVGVSRAARAIRGMLVCGASEVHIFRRSLQ